LNPTYFVSTISNTEAQVRKYIETLLQVPYGGDLLQDFAQMIRVQKAFKVTLQPTHNQEVLINKTIGCARFAYKLLALRKELYSTEKTLNYNGCRATYFS